MKLMKTIKVIDLLNKIANGEIPKEIIYLPFENNNTYAGHYFYDKGEYIHERYSNVYLFDNVLRKLNREVEIIEDKKIAKIDLILDEQFTNYELQAYICETQVKLNEIIDRLNGEDNE